MVCLEMHRGHKLVEYHETITTDDHQHARVNAVICYLQCLKFNVRPIDL